MIHLTLPEYDCEIISTSLQMEGVFSYINKNDKYTNCFIISDQNVYPLYGNQLKSKLKLSSHVHLLIPGEQSKTLEQAIHCWEEMHSKHYDRDTLVIGIGGGVVTDLAGFVASCYMRGVDVIQIPTTLLGMVDAAIGGKTGVNLLSGKNIVGSYHHPKRIFLIPECLRTLPASELSAGLAEVIKYGIIWDAKLFEFLERNMSQIMEGDAEAIGSIIKSSCAIKAEIVQTDPQEKGVRSILNYGHTFAHAIETATQYKVYLHGEAVAIGMNCAAHASQLLGYVDERFIERQNALCQQARLPVVLRQNLSIDTLVDLMLGDKKTRGGKISLIVAEKIGKVKKIANVDTKLIKDAIIATKGGRYE